MYSRLLQSLFDLFLIYRITFFFLIIINVFIYLVFFFTIFRYDEDLAHFFRNGIKFDDCCLDFDLIGFMKDYDWDHLS